MKSKKQLLKKIITSMLENSEQWSLGRELYRNKTWGINLWIGTGRKDIAIVDPTRMQFNYLQRQKLWRAYEESIAKNILKLNKQ